MRILQVKPVLWLIVNLHHVLSDGVEFTTQSRSSLASYGISYINNINVIVLCLLVTLNQWKQLNLVYSATDFFYELISCLQMEIYYWPQNCDEMRMTFVLLRLHFDLSCSPTIQQLFIALTQIWMQACSGSDGKVHHTSPVRRLSYHRKIKLWHFDEKLWIK